MMLKTAGLALALVAFAAPTLMAFDATLAAAAPPHAQPDTNSPIVLAANGCGPGFNRLITGECVPNRRVLVGPGQAVVLPPPCPRGFRRDPDPRRPLCYPVF